MAHQSERLTVGVDLGGTKVETAMVGEDGRYLSSFRCPTALEAGPGRIIDGIIDHAKKCMTEAGATAAALGVGVAPAPEGNRAPVAA